MKKFIKDWGIGVALLITGFFSVMSWHFGEVAKTKAAWTTWDIVGYISVAAFVGGIAYIASRSKQEDK